MELTMSFNCCPPVCPVCSRYVYFAEEIRALGKSFHRSCFKCCVCNKTLDSYSVNDHDGALYCRNCYAKNFGPKVYGYAGGGGLRGSQELNYSTQSLQRSSFYRSSNGLGDYSENEYSDVRRNPVLDSDPDITFERPRSRWLGNNIVNVRCGKCSDVVFANERVDAAGRAFHRLCFKCTNCRRLLDRGSACDHNREIFCQSCYTKLFGSRGLKAGTNLCCE
ncbi:unnamed protein product [Calicophoron daubneyi]|uniref:Cysteine-rich protein 1 n=1 Tax=Calicophoron daubneyi TaxID=300641 RepID=A0AAV2TIU3_CALDB